MPSNAPHIGRWTWLPAVGSGRSGREPKRLQSGSEPLRLEIASRCAMDSSIAARGTPSGAPHRGGSLGCVDFSKPGDVFLADCPARTTLDVITDKWAVVLIFALGRGPRRYTELRELIGGISKKMLTQTLRNLEGHGLVERREIPAAPVRVEYRLTELGATLLEPIDSLSRWAEDNAEGVLAAQARRAKLRVV